VRRSVCSIALLLVCLEWKPNSYGYRTQLPSFPKLQHCLLNSHFPGLLLGFVLVCPAWAL
jgi:hypothetical protein